MTEFITISGVLYHVVRRNSDDTYLDYDGEWHEFCEGKHARFTEREAMQAMSGQGGNPTYSVCAVTLNKKAPTHDA